MALAAKYFVTSPQGVFIDWSWALTEFSVIGKEIGVAGGGGVDSVYVGAASSANASGLMSSGGDDKLYLTGNFADYAQSVDQYGTYTLTRTAGLRAGQTEVIKFSSGADNDVVYFANGHVFVGSSSTQPGSRTQLQDQENGTYRAIEAADMVPGGTPENIPSSLPAQGTQPTKIYVFDPAGLAIPQLQVTGQSATIQGGGGVDIFYVRAATSANASGLMSSGGDDRLYLTGNFADYAQTVDEYGTYTFTRMAGLSAGQTEVVKFSSGADSDAVYFADGRVVVSSSVLQNQGDGTYRLIGTADLTLSLSDTTAPSTALTTLAGTAGNSVGETIELTLTFDSQVNGLTSGTNGAIFMVAGSGVDATWSGTDGSATRKLTYTVAAGQSGQATIDEAALKAALVAGITSTTATAFSYTANSGNIANIDAIALPVVDTKPPSTPLITLANDTGVLNDGVSTDPRLVITGLEPGAQWQYQVNEGAWVVGDGSSIAASVFTNEGINRVLVQQSDAAGNSVQSPVFTFSYQLPPSQTATITSVTDDFSGNGSTTGALSAGQTSDDSTLALAGTLSQSLKTNEVLAVYNGSTRLGTATVNSTSNDWTYTTTALPSGLRSLTARVENTLTGHVGSASTAFEVNVLTSIAITTVSDAVGTTNFGPVADGARTDDLRPALLGTLSAALASGDKVGVYAGSDRLGDAVVNGLDWSFQPGANLPEGSLVLTARVESASGDVLVRSSGRTLIIDSLAPVQSATITGVTDNDSINGSAGSAASPVAVADGTSTDDTTPTLNGTLSSALLGGQVVAIYDTFAGAMNRLGTATVSGNTNWTFTSAALPAGHHSFTAVVETSGTGLQGTASPAFVTRINSLGSATVMDDVGSQGVQATTAYRYVMVRQGDGLNTNFTLGEITILAGGRRLDLAAQPLLASHPAINTANPLTNINNYSEAGYIGSEATTDGWIQIDLGQAYQISWVALFDVDNFNTGVNRTNPYVLFSNTPMATATGVAPSLASLLASGSTAVAQFPGTMPKEYTLDPSTVLVPPVLSLTDDARPTLTGTLATPLGGDGEIAVYDTFGGATTKIGVATVNGLNWSFTPAADLANGKHSLQAVIQALDGTTVASGRAISAAQVFTVDASTPAQAATITSVTDNLSINASAGSTASPLAVANGSSTDDTTPTLSGTLSAVLTGAQVVAIYDTVAGVTTRLGAATLQSFEGTSWTFTPSALALGRHSFTAVVENTASGQQSTAPRSEFVAIINSLGTLRLSDDVGNVQGTVAAGGATDDATPTLIGTLDAALGTDGEVAIYDTVGGVSSKIGVATVSGLNWSFTPAAELADGGHSLSAVIQAIGTTSMAVGRVISEAQAFTVDTSTPTQTATISGATDNFSFNASVGSAASPVAVANGASTDDTTPTLSGTLSAALAGGQVLAIYDAFGGTMTRLGTATVTGGTNWTYTSSALGVGSHSFTAVVESPGSGLQGAASAAFVTRVGALSSLTLTDDVGTAKVVPLELPRYVLIKQNGDQRAMWVGEVEVISGGQNVALRKTVTASSYGFFPGYGPDLVVDGSMDRSGYASNLFTTDNWLQIDLGGNFAVSAINIRPLSSAEDDKSWVAGLDVFVSAQSISSYTTAQLNAGAANTLKLGTTVVSTATQTFNHQPLVPTDDVRPTLSGTLGAALGAGEELAIYDTLGGATTKLGTAVLGGPNGLSWTFTPAADLASGSHSMRAVVQAAGGTDPAAGRVLMGAQAFTIDTAAPAQTVSITSVTDNVSINGSAGSGASPAALASGTSTDDTTPTLSGTLSAALSSVQVLAVYDNFNGATVRLGTATVTGTNWTYTPASLALGRHSFSATVESLATGQAGPASQAFVSVISSLGEAALYDDAGVAQGFLSGNAVRYILLKQTGAAGENKMFVGEIEAFSGGQNVAFGKTVTAAAYPIISGWQASEVVDGLNARNEDGYATDANTTDNWLQVDLGAYYGIDSLRVKSLGSLAEDATYIGNLALFVSGQSLSAFTYSQLLAGAAGATLVGTTASSTGTQTFAGTASRTALTDDVRPTFSGALAAALDSGEEIAIYDAFNGTTSKIGTATLDGLSWSFTTTTDLPLGNHRLQAVIQAQGVNDIAAGRVLTAAQSLTVDNTGPTQTAAIALVTDNVSTNASVGSTASPVMVANGTSTDDSTTTLSGTISAALTGAHVVAIYDAFGSVVTRLGTATVTGGTNWSFTTPTLTLGRHSFTAVVENPVTGQQGTASAAHVTLINSLGTLTLTDDVGAITGPVLGGRTDDARPTLAGSLATALGSDGEIAIYDTFNGATVKIGTATLGGAEGLNWSFTPVTDLATGMHSLRAVIQAAGSSDIAAGRVITAAQTFTLDTTIPSQAAVITRVTDNASINGSLGSTASPLVLSSGVSTDDTTPTLSGTVSAPLSGAQVVAVYATVAGVSTRLGEATTTGTTWTYTPPALPWGSHSLTAVVENPATGQPSTAGASAAFVAIINNLGTVNVADDVGSMQGAVPGGGATDDLRPVVSGTLAAALGAGGEIAIYDTFNGMASKIGTATLGGADGLSWSFTPAADLAAGLHNVQAVIQPIGGTDIAAGRVITAALAFTVDTAAPVLSLAALSDNQFTPADAAAYSQAYTASDTGGSGVASTTAVVKNASGQVQSDLLLTTTGGRVAGNLSTLADGDYSVEVTTVDRAGNTHVQSQAFTIDAVAPASGMAMRFASVSSASQDAVPGDAVTNQISGSVVFSYTGDSLGSGERFQYSVNGTSWTDVSSVDTAAKTVTIAGLALSGSPNVQMRATDAAGNTTALTSQAITYDGVATLGSPAPTTSLSTLAGTAGNSPGETIVLTLNFDGPVNGLTSGTDSTIFTVAGTGVSATWSGVAGTSIRALTYTVAADQNGQAAIDEVALKAALAAGIADAAGNVFTYTANSDNIPNIDASALPVIDTAAPVASVSSVTLSNTGSAVVQSTEPGTAYLVSSTVTVTRLSDILGLASNQRASTPISMANTPTPLTASGLVNGSYKLYTVDAEDNLSAPAAGLVTVDSDVAPALLSVALTRATGLQNSWLNAGDELTATAVFNKAVIGTPTLTLDIGGVLVQAPCTSGSGSSVLTFTYTVLPNQTDVDGVAIPANAVVGSVVDAANNPIDLSYAAVADSAGFKVDTTAPTGGAGMTFTSVSSGANDPAPTDARTNQASGSVVFTYTGDNLGADERFQYSTNGTNWTDVGSVNTTAKTVSINALSLTVSPTVQLRATDAAGNTAALYIQAIIYDATAPTAGTSMVFTSVSSDALDNAPADATTNQTSGTVVFTYSGSDLGANERFQYSTNGTTWADVSSVNATANTVTIHGLSFTGIPVVQVRAIDDAGNATTTRVSQAITYDGAGPGSLASVTPSTSFTNLTVRSQQIDAGGNQTAVRVTPNVAGVLAPDGTTTVELIKAISSAGTDNHVELPNLGTASAANSAGTYTYSVYYKQASAGVASTVRLLPLNWGFNNPVSQITFNVAANGAITPASQTDNRITSAAATAVGDGWYRLQVTYTMPTAATSVALRLYENTGAGMYVWGAQLETGSVASAYIPTTTAAVATDTTLSARELALGVSLKVNASAAVAGDRVQLGYMNAGVFQVLATSAVLTGPNSEVVLTFKDDTNPATPRLLADGSQSLAMRLVDAAGNVSTASATTTVTVAATAAATPSLAVTNAARWSEQMDNAGWLKPGMTVTANVTAVKAPNGTQTVELVKGGTAGADQYLQQSPPNTHWAVGTYTHSGYLKQAVAGQASRVGYQLYITGSTTGVINFDIAADGSMTLANTVSNAFTGAKLTAVGDGWYRYEVNYAVTTTLTSAFIRLYDRNAVGVYVWGVQMETGQGATPYILTTSAAITADNTITAAELANGVGVTVNNVQAGDRVELLIDDNPFATPVAVSYAEGANAQLNITAPNAKELTDGAHTLTARVTNALGESTLSTALSFTVNTSGNDTINALPSATVRSGGGDDAINISSGGSSTLLYNLIAGQSADTRGGNGADTVTGFTATQAFGTNGGDKIDISQLLTGFSPVGTTAAARAQALIDGSFLRLVENAGNLQIQVDRDGTVNGVSLSNLATLNGVTLANINATNTELSALTTLLQNQNLVVL